MGKGKIGELNRGFSSRFFWTARSVIFTGLLLSVVLNEYWKIPILSEGMGILALLSWILAIGDSDKYSRAISILLFIVGSILFGLIHTPISVVVGSFAENTSILMVMVLVPLLAIIIDLGDYSESLAAISRDVKNPILLFVAASFLTYAIGSVLLNAAIALIWAIMAPIVMRIGKDPAPFLASSIPRGYNASLLWTPASPSMAVALSLTGISWTSLFGPGVILSLVMLAVATLVEIRNPLVAKASVARSFENPEEGLVETSRQGISKKDVAMAGAHAGDESTGGIGARQEPQMEKKLAWRKTGSLALGLFSFIGAIVLLERLGLSAMQAMPPCILGALLIWSLFLRKPKEVGRSSAMYFSERIPTLSNQFLLMTTAGFIGVAVKLFLQSRESAASALNLAGAESSLKLIFTLCTSLLIWSISILGIHPIIGMTIIYSLVYPMAKMYSGPYVTLTLLLGSALGFNISPISATMLVTSSCCGKNTFETGLKLQWKFVLTMWLTGSFVLSLLNF